MLVVGLSYDVGDVFEGLFVSVVCCDRWIGSVGMCVVLCWQCGYVCCVMLVVWVCVLCYVGSVCWFHTPKYIHTPPHLDSTGKGS